MSAEIFILSGARTGERIVLDATEFRVGGEPNCEVLFDPQQDLSSKGRSALFRLLDDGWIVSCTDADELLVNQTIVSGRTRLRSGDVLRLSSEGPAFSFRILSRAAAAAASGRVPDPHPAAEKQLANPNRVGAASGGVLAREPNLHLARQTLPSSAVPPQAPASAVPAATPAAPVSNPTPAARAPVPTAAAPSGPPKGKTRWILWATFIGGGLAVVALLACAVSYLMTPATVAPAPDKAAETKKSDRSKEMDQLDIKFSGNKKPPRKPFESLKRGASTDAGN